MTTFWQGQLTHCDLCSSALENVMFDCRIQQGMWANVCLACFQDEACEIGTGRGQKYERQSDGRWKKVSG